MDEVIRRINEVVQEGRGDRRLIILTYAFGMIAAGGVFFYSHSKYPGSQIVPFLLLYLLCTMLIWLLLQKTGEMERSRYKNTLYELNHNQLRPKDLEIDLAPNRQYLTLYVKYQESKCTSPTLAQSSEEPIPSISP
eukprot:TRINITY_DN12947_c0_g1_i1.p1 TRINITY_DN12947_c0_g1~~TRINITY_DN12947_c0_g1_i1.p1  ORF type:complete len:136 (+),score=15.71 TRINITY_DN12947_c0_g1_i1:175-582(+)